MLYVDQIWIIYIITIIDPLTSSKWLCGFRTHTPTYITWVVAYFDANAILKLSNHVLHIYLLQIND